MTAVVGVLAALLMSAVTSAYGRVKRMQLEFEGPAMAEHVCERLTGFYELQSNYPPLSAKDLHELGVFDRRIMDFLRWRGVRFHPFSSVDPTNTLVLEVRYSKTDVQRLLKLNLRRHEE